MEANKDEADKCFKMAKSAFSRHDYQKALKLSTKANNMFPCSEYETFMQMCSSKVNEGNTQTFREEHTHNDERLYNRRQTTNNETNDRKATNEQENLCRKIVKSKNYYEMLDVSKTDSIDKIKRNYKKLALKLHPDKNPSPLASEAFKKVSTAFQCLTNPKAREEYDLYGDEARVMSQQRYQSDFVTPEQLFEAFFGMNQHNHMFHFRTNGHHHHRNDESFSGNRNRAQYTQFIPLIILLAFVVLTNLASRPPEIYRYQKSSKFNKMLSTSANNIVYYVDPRSFENNYPPKTAQRIKIEYEIEYNYYHSDCNLKRRENQDRINSYILSYKKPPQELYETPKSCKILKSLKQTYTTLLTSQGYV